MKKKVSAIMVVSYLVIIATVVVTGFFLRIGNPHTAFAAIFFAALIILADIGITGYLLKKNQPYYRPYDFSKYHKKSY